MDEKRNYLAGIIILILGVLLLALSFDWYDSRDRRDVRVTRTESRDLLPARVLTGTRSTVTEETTFIVQDQELNSAARAARNSLAARLGISTSDVIVTSIESRDWPDSCLGLARSGQFCAQVIVPGYQVTMQARGLTYIYRTNIDGSAFAAVN